MHLLRRFRINNQITAKEARVIDEAGQQIGVMPVPQAIELARQKGLDLIEIAPTAEPPVCRIMEFGKFRYQQEKEAQKQRAKQRRDEMKTIKISVRSGLHDLEFRARQIDGFLKESLKVQIEAPMRGREKAHPDLARQKLTDFLGLIGVPHKILQEIKRTPAGFQIIIGKQ